MLTSNLDQIIGSFERLPEGLVAAGARTIAVDYWLPRFERAAAKTLRAFWHQERNVARREAFERLTPRLVATLTGEILNGGTLAQFTLSGPTEARVVFGDVERAMEQNAEGRLKTGEVGRNFRLSGEARQARSENLEAVREGILNWVKTEKHKETGPGGRDAGLSDAQIAERLEFILGLGNTVKPATQAMQAARDSLVPVINDYLMRNVGEQGGDAPEVPAETVMQWLNAVLMAWVSLVELTLPTRFEREVAKEVNRLGELV